MSNLVISGNVLGSVNSLNSVRRKGRCCINCKNLCTRVLGAHCYCMKHSVNVNIVRVDGLSADFILNINSLNTLANLPQLVICNFCLFALHSCGKFYSFDNLYVACAAADVVSDCMSYLLFIRGEGFVQKALCTHNHSGNTETALDCSGFPKGLCKQIKFRSFKALNCQNVFPFYFCSQDGTGLYRFSVNQDGAASACTLRTSVFYGRKMKSVSEVVKKTFFLVY